MSDVAALLARSMAKHREAFALRGAKQHDASNQLLEEARRLRLDADALDPNHHQRAWSDEQTATPRGTNTHLALLAFYDRHIGK